MKNTPEDLLAGLPVREVNGKRLLGPGVFAS